MSFVRLAVWSDSLAFCTVAESCHFHLALEMLSNEMQQNLIPTGD